MTLKYLPQRLGSEFFCSAPSAAPAATGSRCGERPGRSPISTACCTRDTLRHTISFATPSFELLSCHAFALLPIRQANSAMKTAMLQHGARPFVRVGPRQAAPRPAAPFRLRCTAQANTPRAPPKQQMLVRALIWGLERGYTARALGPQSAARCRPRTGLSAAAVPPILSALYWGRCGADRN